MTSPPLTRRQYAYLRITGPGTHESITETLALRPTEAWNVGDENPGNGRPQSPNALVIFLAMDMGHELQMDLHAAAPTAYPTPGTAYPPNIYNSS